MGTIARGVRSPRTADPELTVLRHHDLRRAAQEPRMLVNGVATSAPPGFKSEREFMKPRCSGTCGGEHQCRYYDVAKKATSNFYRAGGGTNQWVFDQARMEFSDVLQYGLTYGVNFVGNYLRPPEEDVDDDNKKRLHSHVIQRLQQLRAHLFKERKNAELGDTTGQTEGREAVHVRKTRATQLWNLMYGHTTDRVVDGEVRTRSVLHEHDSELGRHVDGCQRCRNGSSCEEADELQEAASRQRRVSTRRMLASGLAVLSHPDAARRLREAGENEALCDDTRAVAQKLVAEVEGCEGSCFLCRSATVKGERKLRPTLPSLPPPSEWPQADDLTTVRRYVADVAGLREPFEEKYLKLDATFVRRYVSYRSHAARVLGLVALQPDGLIGVTELGQQLLATPQESQEERALLRRAVTKSQILSSVSWYFFRSVGVCGGDVEGSCSGSSLVGDTCQAISEYPHQTCLGEAVAGSEVCSVAGDFEQLVRHLVGGGLEADVVKTSLGGVVSVTDVKAARVSRSVVSVTPTIGEPVMYTVPTRRLLVVEGQVVVPWQDLTSKTEGTARRRARTLRSWRNYLIRT